MVPRDDGSGLLDIRRVGLFERRGPILPSLLRTGSSPDHPEHDACMDLADFSNVSIPLLPLP